MKTLIFTATVLVLFGQVSLTNDAESSIAALNNFSIRYQMQRQKEELKEESLQIFAKAFEILRKIDERQNPDMKRKLMLAIARTRNVSSAYDYPDAFTREELAFINPQGSMSSGPDSLPWFMFSAEEKVTREREIKVTMDEFRYSEDPFFIAAAKAALKNDHVMALMSTGKGLARMGEKELAVEYYRYAVSIVQPTMVSYFPERILEVYEQIAKSLVATHVDSTQLDEIMALIQKAKSSDVASHKGFVQQCEELFDKLLVYDPAKDRPLIRVPQQQNSATPRPARKVEETPLPKLETEFDFYAGEFQLEGWRHPLGSLLKKMPTPAEARQAVQRVLDGKEEASAQRPQANRPEWLKKGEPLSDAIKRVKAIPTDRNSEAKWNLIRRDANLLQLAQACIRHGRLEDALLVMKEITHDVPKADILLAVAFRKYDLADEKQKIANEEKFFKPFEEHQTQYGNSDDEKKREDIYFRDERYCGYVIRLAQRGLLKRAEACLEKISLRFQKTEATYTIAMKYALGGEFEKALRVAQTMKDAGTGSYTSWEGMHADGFGPHYSKLQTMTMILRMAASGEYGGRKDFDPLSFVDEIGTNEARVHLLLAMVSRDTATNLTIYRSVIGIPSSNPYDISGTGEKPQLQDSPEAKNLLRRALDLACEIDDPQLRTTVLLDTLLFLVDARMADESYRAADLIDTTGDYAIEQKVSEYSYNTVIPSQIAEVVALLIAEQQQNKAIALCQKVIHWIKPLKADGNRGDFWSNHPNDIRNEIVCRYAELLAEAGAIDKARQTLAEERIAIDSQTKKGPYLQRVAEVQAKIGDREAAKQTYIDAISNMLDNTIIWQMYTSHDQLQYFDKIIESYCNFATTN